MKRFLLSVVLVSSLAFTSCQFDDSDIWDKFGEMEDSIRDHEQRISALEELCKQMNTNIEALQTLVAALEKRDYVTNVSEVRSNGEVIGYTISFAYSDTVTIYHGQDGKDGINGKDGYTPQIGVMKDTDGIYYWTLDGEWLLDGKGNKIQANGVNGTDGTNGSNGTNGTDGVTPQLKIENDYWFVSYDNGVTWEKLGKATGEDRTDGSDGVDGDILFKKISISEGFVVFILNDGNNTQIKLPFTTDTKLCISLNKAGELQNNITIEEQRSVTSLQINGRFNINDLIFINTYIRSIEFLDLSDATYEGNENLKINPLGEIAVNRTLRHVIIGNQIKNDILDGAVIDPSYCIALETLTMTTNHSRIAGVTGDGSWPIHSGLSGAPNLSKLVIAEGVTELAVSNNSYGAIYCICPIIELPSTLTIIDHRIFGLYWTSTVFCNAKIPPCIYTEVKPISSFYDYYDQMKEMTLYVPVESVNTYKSTPGWSQFGTILPIE